MDIPMIDRIEKKVRRTLVEGRYKQCECTCGAYSVFNFLLTIGKKSLGEEETRFLSETILYIALNNENPLSKGANPIKMASLLKNEAPEYNVSVYGPNDLIIQLGGFDGTVGDSYSLNSLGAGEYFIGIFIKTPCFETNLRTILEKGEAGGSIHYMLCCKNGDSEIVCYDSNDIDSWEHPTLVNLKTDYLYTEMGILLSKK